MTIERIVAAVIDVELVTLYKENGETITLKQGEDNTTEIVNTILPVIRQGGVAEIDLSNQGMNKDSFGQFERKSSGLVRFFKIAKSKVAHIFGSKGPETYGNVPITVKANSDEDLINNPAISVETKQVDQIDHAVSEIMKSAQPTSKVALKDDETIIAVVDNKKIIPEMEKLKSHIDYSNRTQNTVGVENLIKRLSAVIDQRKHSVQDVLTFLEKADLPIADDGSIIAYKVLQSFRSEVFVDCHTKKVQQRVGSFVSIPENMVDTNRNQECSNGLHIARRSYLGGFGGDVCTLVAVAPEDIMTVPHRDPNKVRVKGYHILFRLSSKAHSILKANRPMTEEAGIAELLTKAIRNQYPAPHEDVLIQGSMGTNVKITSRGKVKPVTEEVVEQITLQKPLVEAAKPAPAKVKPVVERALDDNTANPEKAKVSPVAVSNELIADAAGTTKKDDPKTLWAFVRGDANQQNRKDAAQALIDMKKKKKVSWIKMGFDDEAAEVIQKTAAMEIKPEPVKKAPVKKAAKPVEKVLKPVLKKESPLKGTKKADGTPTTAQNAANLYKAGKFADLKALKTKTKVSWEKLGFDALEIDHIKSKLNG